MPPAESCVPERLTQVTKRSGSSPSRSQRAVCSQASRSASSPSCMIMPGRLGRRDELAGETDPRVGEVQRSSASTPTMAPPTTSISGW